MLARPRSFRMPLAALAFVALLAGCGDDGDASPSTSTTAPPTTTEGSTSGPTTTDGGGLESTPTTTTTEPDDGTIRVEFAGGQVVGGVERYPVEVGTTVRIEVTSDTADEVHLHGYDVFVDVEPGVAAVLEVQADIPGVFEAELEDSHLPLFELEVS